MRPIPYQVGVRLKDKPPEKCSPCDEWNLANEILDLIINFGRLKAHIRTGWLARGIGKAAVESVADHVSRTAFVAMILADKMGTKKKLDLGLILRMAILHDLAETLLTDIDRQAWQYLGLHLKAKVEEKAIRDILRHIPSDIAQIYIRTWRVYSRAKCLEAKIVQASDKLELVIQALEYVKRGIPRENVEELVKDAKKRINSFGILEADSILNAVCSRLGRSR